MIQLPPEILFWLILGWLFVLGTVLGSFLNVCIYRIPQHEQLIDQFKGLISPPSHCPKCDAPIKKTDNVPILGWLRLGGRCRNCRSRISFRYPLIELLNGLLFVVVYWLELPDEFQTQAFQSCTWSPLGPHLFGDWSNIQMLHLRYLYHMILLEALLVASLIDIDTMTIPDGSTLPAMTMGVLAAVGLGQMYLVPVWFHDPSMAMYFPAGLKEPFGPMMTELQYLPHNPLSLSFGERFTFPYWVKTNPHLHGLAVSLAGLVIGGGLVWGVRVVGQWTLKREAMGFGDVILMAMIGSFLGWQPTLVAFFLAPFFAMLITGLQWIVARFRKSKSRETYIPYGPYLSLGALCVVLGWKWMWPYVGRWFSMGPFVPLMGIVLLLMMIPALLFVQFIKRLLGLPLYPETEMIEEWTSADTLTYLAGEFVERDRQDWTPAHTWPGTAAAQGNLHEERWRRNDHATGWGE